MADTFHLSVRTPEAEILSQEVNSIKVNTEGGEMEIYPHHASLTGSILFSRLDIRNAQSELQYLVQQGILFFSVEHNSAQLLCYSCKEQKDIEYKTAKHYLEFINEKLAAGADLNDFQIKYLETEKIAMVHQMKVLEKVKAK
ncbi:MAG: hypothetical protein Q8O95_01280 [bacterium]|nr:hypothetical protein [bacterium]